MIQRVIKKLKKVSYSLKINCLLLKLRSLIKLRPRFGKYKIGLLGYKIYFTDLLAFFGEMIYIFQSQIYHFSSTKKNPLIIDAGAYIGNSIFYFKHLYPEAEILAFEPDQRALKYLRKNITANHLSKIKIIEAGLYSRNGQLNFQPDQTDGGKITDQGTQRIKVEVLSNYLDQEVDFLKMNIEGAENEVIKELADSGKIKLIKEMCFEWHSFAGEEQNLGEILELLSKNKFKYYLSGLAGVPLGKFNLNKDSQFYLMVYAKRFS